MKRIVKQKDRVYELFLNVRNRTLRVVKYGTWFVSIGMTYLDEKNDVKSIMYDTDHDIEPILRDIYTQRVNRRNPYFSAKTGKPLSKWYSI